MDKLRIAIFDFDGTITKRDTLIDFAIFTFGFRRFSVGAIILSPLFLLCLFRFISRDNLKKHFFSYFFKGMEIDKFNELCKNYFLDRLPKIVKDEAVKKISWHRAQGHCVIIISASVENLINPLAKQYRFDDVIATILEAKGGFLTGNFTTKNCRGEEKKRRFLEKYPDREKYFLYAYSDSMSDRWLLNMADESFYRKFFN